MKLRGGLVFLVSLLVHHAVLAGPAVRFVVSNNPCLIMPCPTFPDPPRIATAGVPFNIYVAALDAIGSRDSNFVGTADFTSSDTGASLPASYTFVPSNDGGKGFLVTLVTQGVQTISVSSRSGTPAAGSIQITVFPGATQPIPILSGESLFLLALGLGLAGLAVLRRAAP